MLKNPFPSFVGFSIVTPENARDFILSPEEKNLLSPRAVKKRRDEFFLGRAACNAALKAIGMKKPPPILKGPLNEPLWPEGIIGSLSHCPGIAVCAVCGSGKLRGLGIDIEELAGDVNSGVHELVCTKKEIKWVSGELYKLKMIFSAKEAAFKAFFPEVRTYMDFKDAELVWNESNAMFEGRVIKGYSPYEADFRFKVGSIINSRYILSYIMIQP